MFYYKSASETRNTLFSNPFDQALDPKNRWVILEKCLPWDDLAHVFFDKMDANNGRPSKNLRIVLGALFIKHIESLSDERTILAIQENIYMQYFVGLPGFQTEPVFDSSLFTYVRTRLGEAGSEKLNDIIIEQGIRQGAIEHRRKPRRSPNDPNDGGNDTAGTPNNENAENKQTNCSNEHSQNKGTLKLDATVTPQNITFPTDVKVLNKSRLISEQLIDKLYDTEKTLWEKKPRTYRRNARKGYVIYSKKRRKDQKDTRNMRKKQLSYLRRNCGYISAMIEKLGKHGIPPVLSSRDYEDLAVIQQVLVQQTYMYKNRKRSIKDRIVSPHQPYVRPIKRGKSGVSTEFGAKINLMETEGFVSADLISFDNFHEGIRLKTCVEAYREKFGYFPQLVLIDQIYLTRDNRKYLKEKGIEHRGSQVGRPPKKSESVKRREKKERNQRNTIEGQFGLAKTRYGLENIKMKTEQTSYAAINLILLAMNGIKLFKSFILSLKTYLYEYLWSLRERINNKIGEFVMSFEKYTEKRKPLIQIEHFLSIP